MATLVDDRWGIKLESTFGTAATVDRFYPWVEVKGEVDNRRRSAVGMIGGLGRRTKLGARSFVPTYGGRGKVMTKVELDSKGLGVLLNIALGVSTVTVVTGGTQQVFHNGITSGFLPSATIQVVKVRNDGTEYVETYAGCTASKITFEQSVEGIPTCEIEWDAKPPVTNIAAATPAFPSNPTLFDFGQVSVGLGAALTIPSTTALATGLTAFGDFKTWKLEIDQNLDIDRWVIGGRNRPIAGIPEISFEGTAEFNANTLPDYVLNGGRFPWYCTYTTTETLGAGFTQLQVVVPQMGLLGDLPKVEIGQTRVMDVKAEVLNDGTNRDFYVAYRTTDAVL